MAGKKRELRTRDPVLWGVLVFLFGIPAIIWAVKSRRDLNALTNAKIPSVWTWLIPGYFLIWWYKHSLAVEAVADDYQANAAYAMTLLLPLVSLGAIAYYVEQKHINKAIETKQKPQKIIPWSQRTDRSTAWLIGIFSGLFFLFYFLLFTFLLLLFALVVIPQEINQGNRLEDIDYVHSRLIDNQTATNVSELGINSQKLKHYTLEQINPAILGLKPGQIYIYDSDLIDLVLYQYEDQPGRWWDADERWLYIISGSKCDINYPLESEKGFAILYYDLDFSAVLCRTV